MDKNKQFYINEFISLMTDSDTYDHNLLLVKHNNMLNMSSNLIDKNGFYHSFRKTEILEPYEPFLIIIREFLSDKTEDEIDEFLENAEVYSLHKILFKQYFSGTLCARKEPLLLDEFHYERRKFRASVLKMLSTVMQLKPRYIVLDEINSAGKSAIWMLTKIASEKEYQHIKIIAIYNVDGNIFPFTQKNLNNLVNLCQEKDMIYNWLLEDDSITPPEIPSNSFDMSQYLTTLNNLLYCFEYHQADYFVNTLKKRLEQDNLSLNSEHFFAFHFIEYWVNLINNELGYALNLCSKMLQWVEESDSNNLNLQLKILCLRILIYAYRGEDEQIQRELLICEKIATDRQNEKILFYVELLRNMSEYRCWKNLWVCDKEVPVSDFLIDNCLKYGYYNHLAHIYAYSFNSSFDLFLSLDNLDERIPEFNKGIALGMELANGKFLIEAYRKNVMLASTNGCFDICIYFYEKMLKVAKDNHDSIEEAAIYNGIGYSKCGMENYSEANEYYEKALSIYYKRQMPDEIIETLYNLGMNAIQARDYNNACEYLLEADYILRTLKKSTMRVCDISKLYGLISLASYRIGNMHRSRLYLNRAREFLFDSLTMDDSIFLVNLMLGILKHKDKKYTESLEYFKKANHHMDRMIGTLWFTYPEYIYNYYQLLLDMGNRNLAQLELEKFYDFCNSKNLQNTRTQINAAFIMGTLNLELNMSLKKVHLENITNFINEWRDKKERQSFIKTLRFFDVLQKFSYHMQRIKDEIASIIPQFKTTFGIDKVLFVQTMDEQFEILYNDFSYDISSSTLTKIAQYFEERPYSFLISKDGMRHDEQRKILSYFNNAQNILSFVAIPVFEKKELRCMAFILNELSNSLVFYREKSFIEEQDLETFTYIFTQLSEAIDKLQRKNELVETNNKINKQIEQVLELKQEAEAASIAKSNFLANMSHEIRTPMNAIIGMAEMVLRGDLSEEQRENVFQIKESGKALLAIINDILDFSKIESGKMDIFIDKYYLHNLIRDAATVVLTRIGDKPIELLIDISPDIPAELLGDNVRIRQIIINLLNNAVKFTQKGYVKLIIDYDTLSDNKIMLKIAVQDTGIGIKEQDKNKLFSSFQQVDSKRNRNIEGTGLGLSITKQLLVLMNGDITLESEYGKGSTFSCYLPQEVVNWTLHSSTSNRDLKVSLLINHPLVKMQLEKDLGRMRIDYSIISSPDECLALTSDECDYLIIEEVVLTEDLLLKFEKETSLQVILLKDLKSNFINKLKNVIVLNRPVYSLELSGIFYCTAEYLSHIDTDTKIEKFTAPNAHVLIVDDNSTNLKVAVGLLEPLKMNVDTALSGKEAVEKISLKKYDIVFMDHMMPELDGVETTHIIRRFHLEYNDVPIIALTANAVSGIKEYFISEGMNDFVAKPIDMTTFISKIRIWLPEEKIVESDLSQEKESSEKENSIEIPGLDTKYALKLLGSEKVYWSILKDYYHNIDTKSAKILSYVETDDIKSYTIEVHALKSSSRQIGAMELASEAEALEKAGKCEDMELILSRTSILINKYQEYKQILFPYFEETNVSEQDTDKELITPSELEEILVELKSALEELNLDQMESVMEKMAQYSYSSKEQVLYLQLKDSMSMLDLEVSEEVIHQWEQLL